VDIEALGRLMKGAGVEPARAEAMIEDFLDRSMRENPIEYLRQEAVFLRATLNNKLDEISARNLGLSSLVRDSIESENIKIANSINKLFYLILILSSSFGILIFLELYFRV